MSRGREEFLQIFINDCLWEDDEYAKETFLQKGFSGLFQKSLNENYFRSF